MNVLGIDPGFSSLGWAVVEVTKTRFAPATCGVLRTEKSAKKINVRGSEDNIRRAQFLYTDLFKLVAENDIKIICTETMSWPRNAGVVAKMGIAWGCIASIACQHGIPIIQASPMEIKRKVTGDGKASKERMIAEIKKYPNLIWPTQETLHEHAADAVGAVIACRDSEMLQWACSQ